MFRREPLVDGGDVDGGQVADGELAEPSAAQWGLRRFHAALHGMPAAVVDRVEGGWPAVTAAASAPLTGMVSRLGNGAGDLAPPQMGADGAAGIRLVGADPLRPGPGSATIRPDDADTCHHRLEVRGIPGLPGAQDQRQGPLPVLAGQVQFGRQPAAGAAQRAIARLRCAPAGRLALGIPGTGAHGAPTAHATSTPHPSRTPARPDHATLKSAALVTSFVSPPFEVARTATCHTPRSDASASARVTAAV